MHAHAAAVLATAAAAHAQCTLQQIVPVDLLTGDGYGIATALDADLALVSAYDAIEEAGIVYTLRRVDGTFVLGAKLVPDDADPFDQFGSDVALHGTIAVVGAPLDEVNGFASGSAYVFEYMPDDGSWQQQDKLLAFDGQAYDLYGLTTATDGEFAFIGCPEDDDVDFGAGSVYVYAPDAGAWTLTQKLLAGDAQASARFGEAIGADADTLIIGASQRIVDGVTVGGAYVFAQSGDQWIEQALIEPPDAEPNAEFGVAVDVDGDLAVIGAPSRNDAALDAGAVYVYRRDHGAWSLEARIVPDDLGASDAFGAAVSISAQTLLVGARSQNGGETVGAAYVFRRAPGGAWTQIDRLTPKPELDAAYFGWSVSVDAQTGLIGAPFGTGRLPETGSSFVADLAPCICPADLDLDEELTILDFVLLQQAFAAADPGADVNADGVLSILDFVDYQTLFLAGCD